VMNDDNVKVTAALVDHADQMWIRAAQSRFGGRVILGKDLLEI
jgi:hypothetical protein